MTNEKIKKILSRGGTRTESCACLACRLARELLETREALEEYHTWFVNGSIFALTTEQIKAVWENSTTKELAEQALKGE